MSKFGIDRVANENDYLHLWALPRRKLLGLKFEYVWLLDHILERTYVIFNYICVSILGALCAFLLGALCAFLLGALCAFLLGALFVSILGALCAFLLGALCIDWASIKLEVFHRRFPSYRGLVWFSCGLGRGNLLKLKGNTI